MSFVNSDMIDVRMGENNLTLSEFILGGMNGGSIPISIFGDTVSSSLISKAIEFMKSNGGGSVVIPPNETYGTLKIVVKKNKIGELKTNFEYDNYRNPIGEEARPYTDEGWEVGDIVYNSDFENSDDKSIGWVCVESGIPGVWGTYGANEHQTMEKIKNSLNREIIVELKADGWSDTAPYTQRVYDNDITSDDCPVASYYVEDDSTSERILNVKRSFSYIDDGTTYDGYIDFVCAENKPTVDFFVLLKGV